MTDKEIRRLVALTLFGIGIASLLWISRVSLKSLTAPATKTQEPPKPVPSVAAQLHPSALSLSALLDQPQATVQAEIQGIGEILTLYRRAFGGNPIGQNDDIVSALLGENPKRIAFLPASTPRIRDGKLVDRWGTPYWFHAESGTSLEICSAGPDREMFTEDDVAHK